MAEGRREKKIREKLKESLTKPNNGAEASSSSAQGSPSTAAEKASGDKAGSSNASPERATTPDANCSICLSGLENKSFTDSCFHQFCFVCLLEWSKVKAVCPLCKQPFKSIIHNVRSIEDYDQYHLRHTEDPGRRFRYRTTMVGHWAGRQGRGQRDDSLQRPTRTTARSLWREGRQAATSAFRRRVYERGMRVEQVQGLAGSALRYRDVTPQFFTRNPACCHRLVPWLNRELNVLLRNNENRVQFVLELILDLIKRFDIESQEFSQHVSSFLDRRTDHFVHEFYSFARSPYDMIAYDRHAVYTDPRSAPVQEVSSDSDRDDVIQNPYATMVDLVNNSISMDPVVIDTGVIVLDSDDEEVRPSTSAATSDPTQDSSGGPGASGGGRGASGGGSSITPPRAPARVPRSSSHDSLFASMVDDYVVNVAGTATSGWESPLPSTSSLWDVPSLFRSIMESNFGQPVPGPSTDWSARGRRRERSRSSAETIDSEAASVGTVASSHSSDLMVTGFEKPWNERSPIPLSSDDEQERRSSKSGASGRKERKSRDGTRPHDGRERSRDRLDSGFTSQHREKKSKNKRGRKERKERRRRRHEALTVDVTATSSPVITLISPPTVSLRNRTVTISSPESASGTDWRPSNRIAQMPTRESGRSRERSDLYGAVHNWLEDIPMLSDPDGSGHYADPETPRSKKRRERGKTGNRRRLGGTSWEPDERLRSRNGRSNSRDSISEGRHLSGQSPPTIPDYQLLYHHEKYVLKAGGERSRSHVDGRESRSTSRERMSWRGHRSSKSPEYMRRSRCRDRISDSKTQSRDRSPRSRSGDLKSPKGSRHRKRKHKKDKHKSRDHKSKRRAVDSSPDHRIAETSSHSRTAETSPHHRTPETSPHHWTAETSPHNRTSETSPHHSTAETSPHNNTSETSPHHSTAETSPHNRTSETSPCHRNAETSAHTSVANESSMSLNSSQSEDLPGRERVGAPLTTGSPDRTDKASSNDSHSPQSHLNPPGLLAHVVKDAVAMETEKSDSDGKQSCDSSVSDSKQTGVTPQDGSSQEEEKPDETVRTAEGSDDSAESNSPARRSDSTVPGDSRFDDSTGERSADDTGRLCSSSIPNSSGGISIKICKKNATGHKKSSLKSVVSKPKFKT